MKYWVASKLDSEKRSMTCKFRVCSYAKGMIPNGIRVSVCVENNSEKNFTKT